MSSLTVYSIRFCISSISLCNLSCCESFHQVRDMLSPLRFRRLRELQQHASSIVCFSVHSYLWFLSSLGTSLALYFYSTLPLEPGYHYLACVIHFQQLVEIRNVFSSLDALVKAHTFTMVVVIGFVFIRIEISRLEIGLHDVLC